MGASPRSALLSLVLPPALLVVDFEAIVDGFMALASAHGVALIGGNITRSPGPLIVDVTALGTARRRRVLARSGARPGDEVWVSGDIGSAAAGLQSLSAGARAGEGLSGCEAAFLTPEPRVRLGTLLGRNRAATACVDLSDGLADGLHQLAAASGVGIEIEHSAVPVGGEARAWFESRGADPIMAALTGGDDYELLFTVRPRSRSRLETVRRQARGLRLTKIGTRQAGGRRGHHARRGCRAGSVRLRPLPMIRLTRLARAEVAGVAAPHPRLAAAHGGRLCGRGLLRVLAGPGPPHGAGACRGLPLQPEPRGGHPGCLHEPAVVHRPVLHADDGGRSPGDGRGPAAAVRPAARGGVRALSARSRLLGRAGDAGLAPALAVRAGVARRRRGAGRGGVLRRAAVHRGGAEAPAPARAPDDRHPPEAR